MDIQSQISENTDESDNNAVFTLDGGNKIRISGLSGLGLQIHANESSDSLESNYSPSYYSGSDEHEESEYEKEEGGRLEDLIFGSDNVTKSSGARRAAIRVYDTMNKDSPLIFHFSRFAKRPLFGSPPVFHPSKPLVVWPLGDGEVLFANLESNTYFTRLLCCSGYRSCHVFIKFQFSSNGKYLHFAALEGKIAEEENTTEKGVVHLSLQVSTHRLSRRKTTRSPPRLVFRTNISMGRTSSISVSSLPYTFTWTARILYVTTRGQTLNVCQIPLFPPDPESSMSSICYDQKELFLPRTAESRNVHYFPPRTGAKLGKEDQATVMIGSHSSIPSQGILVPKYEVSPPIGFYLNAAIDLGGWKCSAVPSDMGCSGDRGNNAGGRLQGKFETFDREEDCDIVPYLF